METSTKRVYKLHFQLKIYRKSTYMKQGD
jgi:hypothetical protein